MGELNLDDVTVTRCYRVEKHYKDGSSVVEFVDEPNFKAIIDEVDRVKIQRIRKQFGGHQ